MVQPKKHLGQHFLIQESIAERIAGLVTENDQTVLEIGPGKGVLTKYLTRRFDQHVHVIEIDDESVEYLKSNMSELSGRIIEGDFLKLNIKDYFDGNVRIAGNFPYNISSQIMFRVLEYRDVVSEVVGMFQKEVADRIAAGPGSKVYGILSVLIQAFYSVEYVFTVQPGSFFPPPKVKSGVIRLVRNDRDKLDCDEDLFFKLVKMAFNQRRKTLRNSIRKLIPEEIINDEIFNLRPEQLSTEKFEHICNMIQP